MTHVYFHGGPLDGTFRNKIREEVMVMQPQGNEPVVEIPGKVLDYLKVGR